VAKIKMRKELIIEKAVEVFGNINQKIKSLIDCSAKDFDTLNQSFKEYHTTIKDLTEKATLLFKNAAELPIEKIDKQLTTADSMLGKYKNSYTNLLEIDRFVINLINETAYSYLYFNNLKQNISTLKLLTTNLQLEPNYRKLYKNLLVTINNLSESCHKFDREFQLSENQIKAGVELIDQIKNQYFSTIFQSMELVQKNLTELISKKAICSDYDKLMVELLTRKSISSSEIITNLQFQDIVRQKIEHVQFVHEELLKQLQDFYHTQKKGLKNKFELNLEIILQIRNIGSLQAAQLVHANSEYQKAVKNITEKFGDLDLILDETLRLLTIFITSGDSMENYFYKEFEKGLSSYKQNAETFKYSHSDLHLFFSELIKKTESFYCVESNFISSLNNFKSIFDELKKIKENQEPNIHGIDTVSQILINFDEFKNTSNNLCKILTRNKSEVLNKLVPSVSNYFSGLDIVFNDTNPFITAVYDLIPRELYSLINMKEFHSEKDLFATKFNINKVEYYTIFEKEVDAIISSLNQMINLINFDEIEGKIDTESLEQLKKLYTMKSERDVHNVFTGKTTEMKETENEIEFF
jgi:hypothetical protein